MKVFVITEHGHPKLNRHHGKVVEVTMSFDRAERYRHVHLWNNVPMFLVEEFELDGAEAMTSAKS